MSNMQELTLDSMSNTLEGPKDYVSKTKMGSKKSAHSTHQIRYLWIVCLIHRRDSVSNTQKEPKDSISNISDQEPMYKFSNTQTG